MFLGFALFGAEWVLYVLVGLSILSIALIIERYRFYRRADLGREAFQQTLRQAILAGETQKALETTRIRHTQSQSKQGAIDFDTAVSKTLLEHITSSSVGANKRSVDVLEEVAEEAILQTKTEWEKSLTTLATIGNNAPFVGLFGTVIGIIQAFRDISEQAGTGAHKISSGLADALVATAVGILVAIPAVAAYNLYQRRVKKSLQEAQALKSFLIGKLTD